MQLHEPGVLEPSEQPAEVARVDVDRAAQSGHLGLLPLRELVDDTRLRQRIGAVEQPVAEQAHDGRVEAVERAHGGDSILRRRGVHAASVNESVASVN